MKWLLTLTLFLYANSGYCQDSVIIGNKGLNRIYEMDGPIHFSHQVSGKLKFVEEEGFFSNFPQSLIKGEKELFINIEGTGRVYKVKEKKNDSLFIQRLDSTFFFGYNNNAYTFNYNDSIMSLGGFGYWRFNGQLRFYSFKNREWDILPLNEEIPVTKECLYYDRADNQIYFLKTSFTDPAINKEHKHQAVYKLNLATKTNVLLGELSPEVANNFKIGLQYLSVEIPSLGGELVVLNGREIYLYHFKKNEVYKLASKAIEKTIFSSSSGVYVDLMFEKNGNLYFSLSNNTSHHLDSIAIKLNDFSKQEYPLYIPSRQFSYSYLYVGIVVLSLFVIFIYRRRKRQNCDKEIRLDTNLADQRDYSFKPNEIDLIKKIYQTSLAGNSYSVEDINQALGLSKKSVEIQKKIRTETINRINHRFKLKFNTEEDLIERVRLEEDRRFYKYLINEENGKKALGI